MKKPVVVSFILLFAIILAFQPAIKVHAKPNFSLPFLLSLKPRQIPKFPKPKKPAKPNKLTPTQSQQPTPTESPAPTATPTFTPTPTITSRPIPHGKKLFFVSTNQPGPKMWRGFLDPYDPQAGENQTLSIEITNSQPVESVNLTVKTDNGQHPIPMTLVEGGLLNGRWQGSWLVDDTYLYNYHAVFEAAGGNGTSVVDITLR